ncbi:hypothetical protein Bca52824_028069 [Brassica carinata]|uniref:RING-type domain-containing protein n=1 Tax=Brassica carinata TaxID=52824 RepID=A0A8X7VBS2_BRACI|nr:hypothetical protein Bca52824_028069 [Brassica carinata]
METTLVTIDVDETSLHHHHPSARNPICINLVNQIQRFAIDESSETKTCTGRYPSTSSFSQINLGLHDYEFSPSYLFSLIEPHLRSPHKSDLIAEEMAYWAIRHIFPKRKPYRMFVNVVTTENVFVKATDSHQKEEEEEEEEEEKSTCAICLEDMLKDEKMELLFSCSHRFHLRCIAVWLQNSDSCPLCRQNLWE